MTWTDELAEEARRKHMRAVSRLNSRVDITVEWSEGGVIHSAPGYTVDISSKGCMAIVDQGFPLGQKIRITNSINGKTADAKLIWRGHEGRKGWELGLELEQPADDFWGLDF